MSSRADVRAMAANLVPRPRTAERESELASTPFGQLQQEAKAPIDIPMDRIRRSPFQRRADFSQEDVETLALSIGEQGLVTPIVVRRIPGDCFELITGHKRTEAFKMLGRDRIPAVVRELSDREAARALTSDNTLHKGLTDWELYKHLAMLRDNHFHKNTTDLAELLGVSRQTCHAIEAFGALPDAVQAMLEVDPGLIGSGPVYALAKHCADAPDIVTEAFTLIKAGKLKATAAAKWIEQKLAPAADAKPAPARHEFSIAGHVRLVAVGSDIRLSGMELNAEKLAKLIEENLADLYVGQVSKL